MKHSFGKSIARGLFRSLVTVYALFTCSLTFGQSYIKNWDSIEIMPAQDLISNPTYMNGGFRYERHTSRTMHGYEVSVSYEEQLARNEYSNVHLLVFSPTNKGKFLQRINLGFVWSYRFGSGVDSNSVYIAHRINGVGYLSKLTVHANSDVEIKKVTLDLSDFNEHRAIDLRLAKDYVLLEYSNSMLIQSIYTYSKSDFALKGKNTPFGKYYCGFVEWEEVLDNIVVVKPEVSGGIKLAPVFINLETFEQKRLSPDYGFGGGIDYTLCKVNDKVMLEKFFVTGNPFVDSANCLDGHNLDNIYVDQYSGQAYGYANPNVLNTCPSCGPKPQGGWYKLNPDLTWGEEIPNSENWGISNLEDKYIYKVGYLEEIHNRPYIENCEDRKYWERLTSKEGRNSVITRIVNDTVWVFGNNYVGYVINWEVKQTTSVNNTRITTANIYPNPATNVVYIPQGTYTITDAMGRTVLSAISTGEQIDVSNLPNGAYFVQILHNNTIATAKLLKQ